MWSLGCILFLLLSGQVPFRDLNSRLADGKVIRGEWNMDKEVSAGCSKLLAKCVLVWLHPVPAALRAGALQEPQLAAGRRQ